MTEAQRTVAAVTVVMGIITLAMGLRLSVDDFRRLKERPRAFAVGLAGQLVLLPALAFAIAFALDAPAEVALGLVLIAASPGGAHSNLYAHFARGDVPLSISLTGISNAVVVVTLPIVLFVATGTFAGAAEVIRVSPVETALTLFCAVLLPLGVGIQFHMRAPEASEKAAKVATWIGTVLLVSMIAGSVAKNASGLAEMVRRAGGPVLLLNVVVMLAAVGLARAARLPKPSAVTIGLEVGIQNGALAVGLALAFGETPGVSMAPILYSIAIYFTSLPLVVWGRRASPTTP